MAHIRMPSESAVTIRKLPKLLRKTFQQGKCLSTHAKINYQEYFSNWMQFDTINVQRRSWEMENYHNVMPFLVFRYPGYCWRHTITQNFPSEQIRNLLIFQNKNNLPLAFVLVKIIQQLKKKLFKTKTNGRGAFWLWKWAFKNNWRNMLTSLILTFK